MTESGHAVFASHPLTGEVALSTGTAPTPYHVYDGHGLVLVGTCNAQTLAPAFSGQDVSPVLTASGAGILILFICDFPKASHGPHLEFHVTALASAKAGTRIADDPAAALAALARRRDWGVLSLHLWNDSPEVVAYNSEYLGLQARQCRGEVSVAADAVTFDLSDGQGAPLATGRIRRKTRSDAGLMWRVMRHLGWGGLREAVQRKPAIAHVINRKGDVIPRNGRARTMTAPDRMILSGVDPARDRLDLSRGLLARYGFRPRVAEHLWPFRFVYLHPDAS